MDEGREIHRLPIMAILPLRRGKVNAICVESYGDSS
jgi:hypothetical protein